MTAQLTPRYAPAHDRYERMTYRRVGQSGLQLPAISFGTWHGFGDDTPIQRQRELLRHAFDLGIIHFDLANGYGPPFGSTEANVGRILREDFAGLRSELILSTKAGYPVFPGPNGSGGGRKHLFDSIDNSLHELGTEYVDIFYNHRFDPETPLEETASALDAIVRSGRARYIGISSYSATRTREMAALLRELGTPLLIHQPSYSMLNRWIESGQPSLLDVTESEGVGVIGFSGLAQGLLTNKYLNGIPEGSRVTQGKTLREGMLSDENLERVQSLNAIAERRGQTLAQLAIAWVLRDPRVTSALIGASRPEQLDDLVGCLDGPRLMDDELREIDQFAVDGDINIWTASSDA